MRRFSITAYSFPLIAVLALGFQQPSAQADIMEILMNPSDNCTESKKVAVCTDESVKLHVAWACEQLEKEGQAALPEVKLMRFSCCNEPNYVWINDLHPKMILHPVKSKLDNQDLTNFKDENGKQFFVEMVKAANETPSGAWVEYLWPRAGEKKSTPKKSWVRKCKVAGTDTFWLAGAGTWK